MNQPTYLEEETTHLWGLFWQPNSRPMHMLQLCRNLLFNNKDKPIRSMQDTLIDDSDTSTFVIFQVFSYASTSVLTPDSVFRYIDKLFKQLCRPIWRLQLRFYQF